MKIKHLILFLFLFGIFQLVDYFFLKTGSTEINRAFIFGFFGGNFLAVFLDIVLIGLLYLFVKEEKSAHIAFIFLAAAVASNIADRMINNGVVDYIKFWFIPIFNFADILIVSSIIFIFWQILKKPHQDK